MKQKLFIFLCLALVLLSVNVLAVTSLSTPSVCCEKTISGGTCINTDQAQCDTSLNPSTGNPFQVVPTSCESTSFCKQGTCYDSKEGVCLENTPQKVCEENNGTWSEQPASALPVCQLGCCIIADQAAFVTQTRCKSLSSFYGVKIDFQSSITSEFACIEAANAQDEGACVSYDGNVKTCKFTTRKDCGGTNSILTTNTTNILDDDLSGKQFYKDVLCSAEELGTVCARQVSTTCYNSKVYWEDSCGNRENVYSSNKDQSWNDGRVAEPDAVCALTGASTTCGNCDYLLGSRCDQYTGVLGIGKPTFGDKICKTTSCVDRDGKSRMNGESWCVYDSSIGQGKTPPGSRSYREICSDGEIQVEACEDFRNQICIHSGIASSAGEYSVAACRVNRWQDCTGQTIRDDCENTDQRDCLWIATVEGVNFTKGSSTNSSNPFSNPATSFSNPVGGSSAPTSSGTTSPSSGGLSAFTNPIGGAAITPITGYSINHLVGSGAGQWEQNSLNNKLRTNRTDNAQGLCIPLVAPGQKFWEKGDSKAICSQASAECTINVTKIWKKDILTGKKELDKVVVTPSNSDCLKTINAAKGQFEVNPDWAAKVNAVCTSLGDCGANININGVFTDKGYEWRYNNDSYYITESDVGQFTGQQVGQGTGEAVAIDYVINNDYKLGGEEYVYIKEWHTTISLIASK